jgi:hypothetical protein
LTFLIIKDYQEKAIKMITKINEDIIRSAPEVGWIGWLVGFWFGPAFGLTGVTGAVGTALGGISPCKALSGCLPVTSIEF